MFATYLSNFVATDVYTLFQQSFKKTATWLFKTRGVKVCSTVLKKDILENMGFPKHSRLTGDGDQWNQDGCNQCIDNVHRDHQIHQHHFHHDNCHQVWYDLLPKGGLSLSSKLPTSSGQSPAASTLILSSSWPGWTNLLAVVSSWRAIMSSPLARLQGDF